MDEETIKERLKELDPKLREILYYRCPATLKPIKDIPAIVSLSESSVNNAIRRIKDVLEVDEFGDDICRVLYAEYGAPPYSEEPPEQPPVQPETVPPPEPQPDRDGRIPTVVVLGLAGLLAILLMIAIATILYLVIVRDGSATPTVQAQDQLDNGPILEPEVEPSVDIGAVQTQAAFAVITRLTAEAPPPTNTPAQSIDTPTPFPRQPTNTPGPTKTPRPTDTTEPLMALPFDDTFDLRPREEWQAHLGTWRVVDGWFTPDSSRRDVRIEVGDDRWRNYTVDVDAWSDDWVVSRAQIYVRLNSNGYLMVETYEHDTDWILYQDGSSQTIAHSDSGTGSFSPGTAVGRYDTVFHFRVEVQDDIYTFFIDGARILQVQDSTFSNGRVAIGSRGFELTRYDNVMIHELP